ncbi:hypothetical protein H8356DRAFT_1740721 [Neocallimastix lanati (nom. inval.)]|jgi:hypothetical protein|uniref:UBA domain-containing protein n=1 Tax=Neocallimastix californiae TaxID=1754190 RepID=A0A1Y2CI94_9FUNG|nr:hypothetical protein H8356DRAFT_1740721 [Neocallimastix sp. JGI-2020a]ORY46656.1 hypothetical protein LY90DRAFT_671293 [Neocallimastix californiae]|eukprot:ORY46656.1 hypothetical protein LY90DRAFT_671293 [Neocallimastix californiae]
MDIQVRYQMLKGVKAELSLQYQIPELVSLPYEYVQTNDRIIEENNYDFIFETKYLENYEKEKKEEEEKRKQELKAKAPGLSDKVLQPVRVDSHDSLNALNQENKDDKNKQKNKICISDFEDVAPLDPWDKSKTNKDELLQLQMELNDMSITKQNTNYNVASNNTSPQLNNTSITASNTVNNPNSSPSINSQPSINYSSTYQTPPIQQTTSPTFPSLNPYGMPQPQPQQPPMFNGIPYPPYQNTYPGINSNIPSMPQPLYQQATPYTSSIPPPIPSRPNTQPYGQTSKSEEDNIVDSVVDMGFRRELVLNGMRNYGNDKRKIIDYVMLYSYLEGRGFQPKLIDEAIFLYSFNREKCEKFLTAFMELSEMGFEHEAIKEALIFSENDREGAIDQLTKSR